MKDDFISRAAALDALGERPVVWTDKIYYILGARNQYDMDRLAIETVPSTQLGWIPWNSGKFPEESGCYIVTAYDGSGSRVTFAKYQKRLKRWELTGARAYWRVLAWQPLPIPYREGEHHD